MNSKISKSVRKNMMVLGRSSTFFVLALSSALLLIFLVLVINEIASPLWICYAGPVLLYAVVSFRNYRLQQVSLLDVRHHWLNPFAKTGLREISINELRKVIKSTYNLDITIKEDYIIVMGKLQADRVVQPWLFFSPMISLGILLYSFNRDILEYVLKMEGINLSAYTAWLFFFFLYTLWFVWRIIDDLINREYTNGKFLRGLMRDVKFN